MLAFTSATQIDEYKLRLLESRMTERVDSPPRQEVKSPSPSPKQKHTKVVSDEVDDEPKRKREKRNFTQQEDDLIQKGYRKFPNDWDKIVQYTGVNRTPRQVQSRFQRMKKRIFTDLDGETSPSRGSPPKKLAKMETQKEEKEKNGYSSSEGQIENLKLKLEDKQEKIIKLKKQISEYKKKLDHNTLEIENQRKEIERLKSSDTLNEFKQQYQSIIKQFVTENAKSQLEIKKNKIWEDSIRLGSELICPTNTYFMGGEWQPGASFQQLEIKRLQLEQKKQTIKDKKKEILKEKAQLKTKMSSQGISAPITTPQYVEKLEALTFVEENLRYQLTTIKKEINQLLNTKEQLTLEFQIHSKHVRLISAQEISKFKDYPVLKDRYVLQNLLGRGGFSEVYAAYDLEKHQIVACKIHQLDENWTENKKSNYLKHAIREYSIHKIVNNERVVRLYDVFEIHSSCFCTILEYCPDGDLDWRLKCKKYFSEKEARCIMVQIIEGLRYLSTLDKPVIHYDLKPGNILFNNREVKLTDFGLSKILESPSSTVDLTSQGTGTYWYLPPECFCRDPKISSKVDVWSAGVVCYQMLFGEKPFGNTATPFEIYNQGLISESSCVKFPSKPQISDEAKSFISLCLTTNADIRPDIFTISEEPFLKIK